MDSDWQHHETTQAFIRSLEFLAPSVRSIEAMRSHPVYAAFERRWQLPVYFQLRWKDIVSKLEEALSITTIDPSLGSNKDIFVTKQAAAVWLAISTSWSAEVYLPELNHRFWKFTLQVSCKFCSDSDYKLTWDYRFLAGIRHGWRRVCLHLSLHPKLQRQLQQIRLVVYSYYLDAYSQLSSSLGLLI